MALASDRGMRTQLRDPTLRRSALYWFRLRHKSAYHRAFAVAALRRAKEKRA